MKIFVYHSGHTGYVKTIVDAMTKVGIEVTDSPDGSSYEGSALL